MTFREDYGNLKVMITLDPDGCNIYVENIITKKDGLHIRIDGNEPISRLREELVKIKESAEQLNENFKQL